jgi:hypothetical protein
MKEIVAGILIWFLAVFIMLGINVMSTEMENSQENKRFIEIRH